LRVFFVSELSSDSNPAALLLGGEKVETLILYIVDLVFLALPVGLRIVVLSPVAFGEMPLGLSPPVLPLSAGWPFSVLPGELPRWEVGGEAVGGGGPLNKSGCGLRWFSRFGALWLLLAGLGGEGKQGIGINFCRSRWLEYWSVLLCASGCAWRRLVRLLLVNAAWCRVKLMGKPFTLSSISSSRCLSLERSGGAGEIPLAGLGGEGRERPAVAVSASWRRRRNIKQHPEEFYAAAFSVVICSRIGGLSRRSDVFSTSKEEALLEILAGVQYPRAIKWFVPGGGVVAGAGSLVVGGVDQGQGLDCFFFSSSLRSFV
jgi:hypothetical protein